VELLAARTARSLRALSDMWRCARLPGVRSALHAAACAAALARVSVLGGAGGERVLNSSGMATCPESGWFGCGIFWKSSYAPGEYLFRFRLAVGGSF